MRLIVEPDDGTRPIVSAINKARTSIDIGISRLDRRDVARALRTAVERGVAVRAVVTPPLPGRGARLGRLEQDLMRSGASVRRTGDRRHRHHDKVMVVDGRSLYLMGFDCTTRHTARGRSFGLVTRRRALVRDAIALFEADLRRPHVPAAPPLVVSPVNARARLTGFLDGAQSELCVYDARLTDPAMIEILNRRADAGVRVRILGRVGGRGAGLDVRELPAGSRLHGHAIVRDGMDAFVGNQGLSLVDLEGRREVGAIVDDASVVDRLLSVFETDWAAAHVAAPAPVVGTLAVDER